MITHDAAGIAHHGCIALFTAALSAACATAVPPGRSEHPIRRMVPIPICLNGLPQNAPPGPQRPTKPEEYWPLLWAGFTPNTGPLDPLARDCAGRQPLASFSPGPLAVSASDAVVTDVAQQFKLVWLPVRPGKDNLAVGLLALLRHGAGGVEVYASGAHAGELGATRFTLERIGQRWAVAAMQEKCDERPTSPTCESTASIYLIERGALSSKVIVPLERWATAPKADGVGAVEYHFSSGLDYLATGIQITEHLVARDRTNGEIRSSDLQRMLVLKAGRLTASAESLWQRTSDQSSTTAP